MSNHRDIAHVRYGWDDLTVNSGPEKQLKIGILGCGAIAQAGHFESVAKARNTTLHAICDVAEDLLQRFSVTYGAAKVYTQYERMLADPDLDAVIIATADAFHVPAALDALAAGKHDEDAPPPSRSPADKLLLLLADKENMVESDEAGRGAACM